MRISKFIKIKEKIKSLIVELKIKILGGEINIGKNRIAQLTVRNSEQSILKINDGFTVRGG